MRTNITYSEFTSEVEDVELLKSLSLAVFGESYSGMSIKLGLQNNLKAYGLKYRNKPSGFAILTANGDKTVVLNKFGIIWEARQKGLGSAFLIYLKGIFCSQGFSNMKLITRITNVAAHKLYQKSGFEQLYIDENYYGDEAGVVYGIKLRGI